MLEKVINLIKDKNIGIPKLLLNNYVNLNISDRELIILIYLINDCDTIYNPSKICSELNIPCKEILDNINNLVSKGLINIEVRKINNKREEHIIIDNLYNKLAFIIVNEEKEVTSNIFDQFEKEFGRTLSPMEYEIITTWLDSKYDEELILLALKETVYNHVSSLSYVDRILQDWKKKGIKTKDDVERERIKFNAKKEESKPVFDYDWLNEDKGNN